jgi:hypothetical protein
VASKCACPSVLFHERNCLLVHGEPVPPLEISAGDQRPLAMPTHDGRVFVDGCHRAMVLDCDVAIAFGQRLVDLGNRARDIEVLRG